MVNVPVYRRTWQFGRDQYYARVFESEIRGYELEIEVGNADRSYVYSLYQLGYENGKYRVYLRGEFIGCRVRLTEALLLAQDNFGKRLERSKFYDEQTCNFASLRESGKESS